MSTQTIYVLWTWDESTQTWRGFSKGAKRRLVKERERAYARALQFEDADVAYYLCAEAPTQGPRELGLEVVRDTKPERPVVEPASVRLGQKMTSLTYYVATLIPEGAEYVRAENERVGAECWKDLLDIDHGVRPLPSGPPSKPRRVEAVMIQSTYDAENRRVELKFAEKAT